ARRCASAVRVPPGGGWWPGRGLRALLSDVLDLARAAGPLARGAVRGGIAPPPRDRSGPAHPGGPARRRPWMRPAPVGRTRLERGSAGLLPDTRRRPARHLDDAPDHRRDAALPRGVALSATRARPSRERRGAPR